MGAQHPVAHAASDHTLRAARRLIDVSAPRRRRERELVDRCVYCGDVGRHYRWLMERGVFLLGSGGYKYDDFGVLPVSVQTSE